MNHSNEPPTPNPFLTAYEDFIHNTPYVTRSIMLILVATYGSSWLFDPHFALATIPKFVWEDYEVYRLLLSPLVNTSFISIILAFWNFLQHGIRFERSMGSTAFAWLCFAIGSLSNTIFFLICLLLYFMTDGNASVLLHSSAGIWNILFGTIAMECVEAPRDVKRKFLAWDVPVLYYPIVLLLFFYLLGGGSGSTASHIISAGIGYALGFGKLDFIKLPSALVRKYEDSGGFLHTMTRREGWIVGPAALGSSAWNDASNESLSGRSMFSSLPMFQSGDRQSQALAGTGESDEIQAGSVFRSGRVGVTGETTGGGKVSTNFSASNGRALGGGPNSSSATSQRRVADARAARLQALEKQSQDKSTT